MNDDLSKTTNDELDAIVRLHENSNIPGSRFQRAMTEIELRHKKGEYPTKTETKELANDEKIDAAIIRIREIQSLIKEGFARPLEKQEAFSLAKETSSLIMGEIWKRKAEKVDRITYWSQETRDGFVSPNEAGQLDGWVQLFEDFRNSGKVIESASLKSSEADGSIKKTSVEPENGISVDIEGKLQEVMPEFTTKNVLLLTGAGFTKNFGGSLSREMHSKIFNHNLIQESEVLRDLLIDDYDFESVYWEVLGHPTRYSNEDQERIKKAVEDAYKSLDDTLKGWVFNDTSPYPVNVYGLGKLLSDIIGGGSSKEKGIFFTLNQDLFMERQFQYRWPGVTGFAPEFYSGMGRSMEIKNFVTVTDTEEVLKKAKEDFLNANSSYIKLHGSYGWKSADGTNKMVIGKNKVESISQNLLLFWYFQIFAKAIFEGGKKILIIGYGFNDEHVNALLLEAVKNHDLKIFIISTVPMEKMREDMKKYHSKHLPLMKAIRGYYQNTLLDIFPTNQSETQLIKEIRKALFS